MMKLSTGYVVKNSCLITSYMMRKKLYYLKKNIKYKNGFVDFGKLLFIIKKN